MAAGYHDFTAGEVLTAANLEDYCQNQSAMRFATSAARDTALSAVKTAGMLSVTLDAGERLWMYNGTSWDLISYAGTTGRPGVILTDAAQSISNTTATDITWGTEVSDVDGWTSGGSATLTVPTGWDGRYIISYFGAWAATPGTQAGCTITINGTDEAEGVSAGGAFFRPTATMVRALAATDTIKVRVYQNSGGALNITSRLEIAWLGR